MRQTLGWLRSYLEPPIPGVRGVTRRKTKYGEYDNPSLLFFFLFKVWNGTGRQILLRKSTDPLSGK